MNILKYTRKSFGKWILIPITKYYLSKDRKVKIGNVHLTVPSGVFHPTLFYSTKVLLEYTNDQPISGLKILELGAGSGLLSIQMAKRNAVVTASDVSKLACETVLENARNNDVMIEVIHSDLFDTFGNRMFDLILINPPYYPKNPDNDAEKAWYCGNDFNYFQKLFSQLNNFI
jgi:release factor glutamine methyltransferase